MLFNPASRPKIQCEVDLAVTVDRTGSSERFQSGIGAAYEIIASQVAAKARDVKCWVQTHGDLDEGQEIIMHTDAGTPEQAIDDIKKISYGGGGDPPEHHLDAIESLLDRVPWTADPSRARGAIVAFMTADTKPAKSGVSAGDLGMLIKDKGILLYLICEPTPMLQELADLAEGLVFQISNDPDPDELQRIAEQLAASIVVTVSSGGTVPMRMTTA
ncbi:hypothetical protein JXA32_05485 [Candidatus Sumerlaeota bacterium]|nr:hypothetical protein [Candidatus Sumerlaeota bacterium]